MWYLLHFRSLRAYALPGHSVSSARHVVKDIHIFSPYYEKAMSALNLISNPFSQALRFTQVLKMYLN
jgi:hypothetical protein